jgi:hypothetical protein
VATHCDHPCQALLWLPTVSFVNLAEWIPPSSGTIITSHCPHLHMAVLEVGACFPLWLQDVSSGLIFRISEGPEICFCDSTFWAKELRTLWALGAQVPVARDPICEFCFPLWTPSLDFLRPLFSLSCLFPCSFQVLPGNFQPRWLCKPRDWSSKFPSSFSDLLAKFFSSLGLANWPKVLLLILTLCSVILVVSNL